MADEERLESWKAIAAHLRRDVRTVQRWEQTDGLPIHRHKRTHRAIPYAYKAELDAWWTSRGQISPALKETAAVEPGEPSGRRVFYLTASFVMIALAAGGLWTARRGTPARTAATSPPRPAQSIAVLPFLDLTEGMKEEEFADGMTEEVINRLNRIPGFRIPAPTATFYYKNKKVPVADIARALGVSYVLDGSVRKSGGQLRVAARLTRAESGDVVWSETYDRPWSDVLHVQDDIAAEVTKAAARVVRDDRPS